MLKRCQKNLQIKQAQMNLQNNESINIPLIGSGMYSQEVHIGHNSLFLHIISSIVSSPVTVQSILLYSLHCLLQPHIQKERTHFQETIPSEHCLAIFLHDVALGVHYLAVSNQFGCGKAPSALLLERFLKQ